MRNRSLGYPWGYWSPQTSDEPEPAGWPATVTDPSGLLGYDCAVVGPCTIDEAMQWYWRLRTGEVTVNVQAFGGGGISSETSADLARYNEVDPLGPVLGNGDERLLVCDMENVLDRSVGPPYSHDRELITGVHHAEFPSTGGVSWQLRIITQHLWCDFATNTAFFSISMQLDWTKSGSVELTFRATEQVSAMSAGTLNIFTHPTLTVYDQTSGEPSLTFSISLGYSGYFEYADSDDNDAIWNGTTGERILYPAGHGDAQIIA